MGQLIEVRVIPMGNVAVFDTDRTFTGQDGHDYDSLEEARAGRTFPAALAARLFERLNGIDHVYLLSNEVVVRRPGPWDEPSLEEAAELIRTFFVHYEENTRPEAAERATEEAEGVEEEEEEEEAEQG